MIYIRLGSNLHKWIILWIQIGEWYNFNTQFTNLILFNEKLNEKKNTHRARALVKRDKLQIRTCGTSLRQIFVALNEKFRNKWVLRRTFFFLYKL